MEHPFRFSAASLAFLVALPATGFAQTPEEHASHHPPPAEAASSDATAATPAGAGMGEMMKGMGTPSRKEIYPALMALPDDISSEARSEILQLAQERMKSGAALLAAGLEKLSDSTSGEDYAAMQVATAQMREGLAEFEAGVAARQVLSEGRAPRNVALGWFKREMNLALPAGAATSAGITPFHFFSMALLVAFALAMLAMYFFKMRRAAALFGRIEGQDGHPPPGSSPPMAGG